MMTLQAVYDECVTHGACAIGLRWLKAQVDAGRDIDCFNDDAPMREWYTTWVLATVAHAAIPTTPAEYAAGLTHADPRVRLTWVYRGDVTPTPAQYAAGLADRIGSLRRAWRRHPAAKLYKEEV